MREQRLRSDRSKQGIEVLLRLSLRRSLHGFFQPALRIGGLASAFLPLACFGQSPASVELKPGFAASYRAVEGGKAVGELGIWAAQDALLLRFKGRESASYRLLRSDGSLFVQSEEKGGKAVLFGKPLVESPFNFPFQWASHPVLGVPRLQQDKLLISWVDVSQDPRRDRLTTGKASLDPEGRIRSLSWPLEGDPLGRMTISGWTELVIENAPKRIDLDLQLRDTSQSLTWELVDDAPPPRQGSDFTFEGLLALSSGAQKAVPVADCRVVIESCPVLIYQPGRASLLDQLGTAGHGSLKEKQGTPAALIAAGCGSVILLFAAAKRLMRRKAEGGDPPAPS